MSTAKLIVTGAAALALSLVAMEESTIAEASMIYEVDVDHDGRADRMLMLEQSDSLA